MRVCGEMEVRCRLLGVSCFCRLAGFSEGVVSRESRQVSDGRGYGDHAERSARSRLHHDAGPHVASLRWIPTAIGALATR